MPYRSRKVRGKSCYRVTNTDKKKVFAKCTSKANALKQMKLLRALQFNKNFKPNSNSRTRKNK
jgi:hypothetical protein